MENLCGYLRQQSITDDGLYMWKKKHFAIDSYRKTITISSGKQAESSSAQADNRDEEVVVNLSGVQFAKEWSVAAAESGTGFDIIWESGTVWSFLAEDESSSKKWVQLINTSINSSTDFKHSNSDSEHETTRVPSFDAGRMRTGASSQTTTPNAHAPASSNPSRGQSRGQRTAQYPPSGGAPMQQAGFDLSSPPPRNVRPSGKPHGSGEGMPPTLCGLASAASSSSSASATAGAANGGGEVGVSMGLSPIRMIPSNEPSDKSSSHHTSPESNEDAGNQRATRRGQEGSPHVANPDMYSAADGEGEGAYEEEDEEELHAREVEAERVSLLEHRFRELSQNLHRERAEAEIAREQLLRVHSEMEVRTSTMERDLQQSRDLELKKSQEVRDAIQKRFIEAANDNIELHQANIRALQEQHKRELKLLHSDMSDLRANHAKELKSEILLREEFQQREYTLRDELRATQDKLDMLHLEHVNNNQQHAKKEIAWQKEQELMEENMGRRIAELEAELQNQVVRSKAELNAKERELTDRYSNCLNEVEGMAVQTALKRVEAEKNAAIIALQQQCAREVEAVRSAEHRRHTDEVTKLHTVYREREAATETDLKQLETVYNSRIAKLEKQVCMYRDRSLATERALDNLKAEHTQQLSTMSGATEIQLANLKRHEEKAKELDKALIQAHYGLQEVSHKERAYREQCKTLLEEHKMLKDTVFQNNMRIQQLTGEITMHQKQSKLHLVSDSTTSTSLQIAQQEIQMLEQELRRVKHENQILQDTVNRSDGILYGHSSAAGRSDDENLDESNFGSRPAFTPSNSGVSGTTHNVNYKQSAAQRSPYASAQAPFTPTARTPMSGPTMTGSLHKPPTVHANSFSQQRFHPKAYNSPAAPMRGSYQR